MRRPSAQAAIEPRTTRATRQREAIDEILDRSTEFCTAQDVHSALRRRGHRVGLATVYRQLRVLADAGNVDVLRTPSGEVAYRRCEATSHHHHLICRTCGKTVEFEAAEIERRADKVAREAGFTDVAHTVEIFGTCNACARKRRRD